ncbi:protein-disulfide reductase DsbD domain-containing protein [Halocynthiibacter sp.]|uniref:protein-disulfide reductase DsbD domain-containing protein n=1 Tax=Halocynthiibacter sp. TaxID=1979210 RepID=UPI003C492455
MKKFSAFAFSALTAFTLAGAAPTLAQGFESVRDTQILNGWRERDGTRMAAFRIDLNEGWKTYWRAPGETGIPPQFDWSRSRNVASVQFHWPRPGIHDNAGVRTIGYKDALILPVEITPIDPSQPVHVNVQMKLGVCEEVCIPLTLDFTDDLIGNTGPEAQQTDIRLAMAQKPQSGRSAGMGQVQCTSSPISDGMVLTASLPGHRIGNDDVVVFELPDQKIWISSAQLTREGNTLLAQVDMVPPSATPFALDRSQVRITVIGEDRAVDIQGCHG